MSQINKSLPPSRFNFYARMVGKQKLRLVEALPAPEENHDNVLYLHNDPRHTMYRPMNNHSEPAILLTSTELEPDWTPPKAS